MVGRREVRWPMEAESCNVSGRPLCLSRERALGNSSERSALAGDSMERDCGSRFQAKGRAEEVTGRGGNLVELWCSMFNKDRFAPAMPKTDDDDDDAMLAKPCGSLPVKGTPATEKLPLEPQVS